MACSGINFTYIYIVNNGDRNWKQLAQDRVQCGDFVLAVLNLQIRKYSGNIPGCL